MQRHEHESIVISCDFCGDDWDQIKPMIEGHRGSVLCLSCLRFAVVMAGPSDEAFDCALCLGPQDPGCIAWRHPDHPQAVACIDCVQQAAGTFTKDPDIDWTWDRRKPWKQRQ